MELTTVVVIAFGLALDAFAVSVSSGIAVRQLRIEHALRVALFFGSFQALMPLIGWLAGLSLRGFISQIDHWIAFGLLTLIGCRMICEAGKLTPKGRKTNPLNTYTLLLLAIATSTDALAVGISFAFLKVFIVTPVVVIGVVTFVLSLVGVLLGGRLGQLFAKRAEIIGGVVLIGIGVRILITHMT